jgi:hypothetical protein
MTIAPADPIQVAGVVLPIHPPEDILLQKLRWFRLGGEVSDRQWRDVLGSTFVASRLSRYRPGLSTASTGR